MELCQCMGAEVDQWRRAEIFLENIRKITAKNGTQDKYASHGRRENEPASEMASPSTSSTTFNWSDPYRPYINRANHPLNLRNIPSPSFKKDKSAAPCPAFAAAARCLTSLNKLYSNYSHPPSKKQCPRGIVYGLFMFAPHCRV